MNLHGLITNTILSFENPFTYQDLLNELSEKIDMTNETNRSRAFSLIRELFELPNIRVVPFSRPMRYYVNTFS